MSRAEAIRAAAIVRDAGGRVVGRTRLQKIAYLLNATGLEDDLSFSYKHYGPYSEKLANAIHDADLLGLLTESEQQAAWGGTYSIFVVDGQPDPAVALTRRTLASQAANADAVELELAATALFLAKQGYNDPWEETARRKPEKVSNGRLDGAKSLYQQLSSVATPIALPAIN